jgi:predicted metal-binding membrane protein
MVPVAIISAVAWLLLLTNAVSGSLHAHHMHHGSLRMVVEHNLSADIAAGWFLMVLAMMLPTLSAAIHHVRSRSFARRRLRAALLMLIGYFSVWMLASVPLMFAAMLWRSQIHNEWLPPLAGVVLLLIWQSSPLKAYCRNRMHSHGEIPAFGLGAELGAVRLGLTHGGWCVGSCWTLMLLPMQFAQGHILVMGVTTLWMWAEQLERPERPVWRLRIPSRAMRATLRLAH